MSTKTTVLHASDYPEQGLAHFYKHPQVVRMANNRYPVHKVEVSEADPEGHDGYWAWWDNEDEKFKYIYKSRAAVGLCFGSERFAEEKSKKGLGHLLPVDIEILERDVP
jgi:hypothetical protein